MDRNVFCCALGTLLVGSACMVGAPSHAAVTSGFNMDAPEVGPIDVGFNNDDSGWYVNEELIFDPAAGPMIKHFEAPRFATGEPILIVDSQPMFFPVTEDWRIHPDSRLPVSDWHEEILTPGWVWLYPGSPLVEDLYGVEDPFEGVAESLITRNGEPEEWWPLPLPGDAEDPTMIWVAFPPFEYPDLLDVHKALFWVGTPGNTIWGDGTDDLGTTVLDETIIVVREYPTPEPATLGLLGLGLALLSGRRRG